VSGCKTGLRPDSGPVQTLSGQYFDIEMGQHQHESRDFSLKISISIQDKRGIYIFWEI
jgi:hypothetical protein